MSSTYMVRLRSEWRNEIARYDGMIGHLEAGHQIDLDGSPAEATAQWVAQIRRWRGELESLLLQYSDPAI